jgi:methylphosphotriester-DNA--protein-cysteine methyltransferase
LTYDRAHRLDAIRAALKTDPALGVSEVAREYGFHRVGNFTTNYRRLLGERPSAARGSTTRSNRI